MAKIISITMFSGVTDGVIVILFFYWNPKKSVDRITAKMINPKSIKIVVFFENKAEDNF